MKTDGSDAQAKQVATQTQEKQGTLRDWLSIQQKAVAPSLPAGTVSIERFMESVKFAILDPKTRFCALVTREVCSVLLHRRQITAWKSAEF